jgi:hypothetical protein
MLAVASSPEHTRVIGRREHERGKAEDYGVVLATVTLTWRSSGDLWERAEVAMRLTSGSIKATGWPRRCKAVWWSGGRDLVSGGAVVSTREHGEGCGGNGVSDFHLGDPGQSKREGEESEHE